jgi:hypothetical protein
MTMRQGLRWGLCVLVVAAGVLAVHAVRSRLAAPRLEGALVVVGTRFRPGLDMAGSWWEVNRWSVMTRKANGTEIWRLDVRSGHWTLLYSHPTRHSPWVEYCAATHNLVCVFLDPGEIALVPCRGGEMRVIRRLPPGQLCWPIALHNVQPLFLFTTRPPASPGHSAAARTRPYTLWELGLEDGKARQLWKSTRSIEALYHPRSRDVVVRSFRRHAGGRDDPYLSHLRRGPGGSIETVPLGLESGELRAWASCGGEWLLSVTFAPVTRLWRRRLTDATRLLEGEVSWDAVAAASSDGHCAFLTDEEGVTFWRLGHWEARRTVKPIRDFSFRSCDWRGDDLALLYPSFTGVSPYWFSRGDAAEPIQVVCLDTRTGRYRRYRTPRNLEALMVRWAQ